ncbi:AgrD family cyclic lactone autoinducer peptide [Oscillibacter sp.]|uniref:AgrD family cyclic lactone autoinducer peptide n=1 Tax=Oscillibacter sp. TaxID=1945593 RepID=UPI00289A99BB|nr:cyclic lactone autoinducer peptide [Oscillibacter sp.]
MTGVLDAIHARKQATRAKPLVFSKFCDSFDYRDVRNLKIKTKELFRMKRRQDKEFKRVARKRILHASGSLLMALAAVFAAAPCSAHFYEPEVPRKLR